MLPTEGSVASRITHFRWTGGTALLSQRRGLLNEAEEEFRHIRLWLARRKQKPLTVYTDGFRAYEPLENGTGFEWKYVVHAAGEYADENVHVNTGESHASLARRWLSPHRGDRLTQYFCAFQLRRELYRKPG